MGGANDLPESVRPMEGGPATTLVVEVGGGNVLSAVMRIACCECRNHPS
jgi:hypothetical protein